MDNMDSLEIRIPDEIRDYKEKFGGFTIRQWIGALLVAVVCVPTYYFLNKYAFQILAMIVTMLLAIPIGGIFFIPINGLSFEKMFPYFKRTLFTFSRVLKFKTENEVKLEQEMKKDKKYRKQLKKLQKLEKKQQRKIERGSAKEENKKLKELRLNVDLYNNELRRQKIEEIKTHKKPLSKKEIKRLKKENKKNKKNIKDNKSNELQEAENDFLENISVSNDDFQEIPEDRIIDKF